MSFHVVQSADVGTQTYLDIEQNDEIIEHCMRTIVLLGYSVKLKKKKTKTYFINSLKFNI